MKGPDVVWYLGVAAFMFATGVVRAGGIGSSSICLVYTIASRDISASS